MSYVLAFQPDVPDAEIVCSGAPCAADAPREPMSIARRPAERRARADRLEADDGPWASTVRLPWGLELRLLNISSTGVLGGTSSRATHDGSSQAALAGPDTEIVVGATFVRGDVAFANGLGVTYHIAATFERRLDLLPAAAAPQRRPAGPGTLAHLLARVAQELEDAPSLTRRAAFERGVRELVAARDVRLRNAAGGALEGETTVCFSVPAAAGVGTVLQATFASGAEPTREVLRLLRAAAGLAGVLLEFDTPL
jgi:hypothetical protein